MSKGMGFLRIVGAACLASGAAQASPCAATFGTSFAGLYTCNDVGAPTGVGANLGGLSFLNANTLLVGGYANGTSGYIAEIGVVRDAQKHIIGFSGASTTFATAPYIDGGLSFGPGNVLFATGYPVNTVLEYKTGSTSPDKTVTLSSSSSVGALAFVPAGFSGAGDFKIVQYSGSGNWYDATLTADGAGTYDIATTLAVSLGRGPEGIAYVSGSNPGFGGLDSILLSEYGTGTVGAYSIDAKGDPIVASRRDFLTGLSGAEGAAVDPLTGDFLFSTFGGGNQIDVVSGFTVSPGAPEPATWALMLLGFAGLGVAGHRASRRIAASAT